MAQNDWGQEGALIWGISDLIKEWLEDATIAEGLLDYLRPGSRGHGVRDSERGKYWFRAVSVRLLLQNRF